MSRENFYRKQIVKYINNKNSKILVLGAGKLDKKIFYELKYNNVVVRCDSGIRRYNFGQWALENNLVNEIWNLEEGIDGWSQYIDQTIPRY